MGNQGLWVLWLSEGLLDTQEMNFPYLCLSSVGASDRALEGMSECDSEMRGRRE